MTQDLSVNFFNALGQIGPPPRGFDKVVSALKWAGAHGRCAVHMLGSVDTPESHNGLAAMAVSKVEGKIRLVVRFDGTGFHEADVKLPAGQTENVFCRLARQEEKKPETPPTPPKPTAPEPKDPVPPPKPKQERRGRGPRPTGANGWTTKDGKMRSQMVDALAEMQGDRPSFTKEEGLVALVKLTGFAGENRLPMAKFLGALAKLELVQVVEKGKTYRMHSDDPLPGQQRARKRRPAAAPGTTPRKSSHRRSTVTDLLGLAASLEELKKELAQDRVVLEKKESRLTDLEAALEAFKKEANNAGGENPS